MAGNLKVGFQEQLPRRVKEAVAGLVGLAASVGVERIVTRRSEPPPLHRAEEQLRGCLSVLGRKET